MDADDLRNAAAALAQLLHHRWSIAVLDELAAMGGGAKVVTLVSRLGISRDSLRRTLAALDGAGLAARNPGYGHPMRPEVILTPRGRSLAPLCRRLRLLLAECGLEDLGRRKWPLPVLLALGSGLERFGQLDAALPAATARALTLALKHLQRAGVVIREIEAGYPPTPRYRRRPPADRLVPVLADLARAA